MNETVAMNEPLSMGEQESLLRYLQEIFPFASKARVRGTIEKVTIGPIELNWGIEPLISVAFDDGYVTSVPAAVLEPVDYIGSFADFTRVMVHRCEVYPTGDGEIPRRWFRPAPRAAVVVEFFWFKYEVLYVDDGSRQRVAPWMLQEYRG